MNTLVVPAEQQQQAVDALAELVSGTVYRNPTQSVLNK